MCYGLLLGKWNLDYCRYVLIFLVEQVVDTRRHFYEKRTVVYFSARDLDDEIIGLVIGVFWIGSSEMYKVPKTVDCIH